jgi:hypothetical protein
MSTSPAPPLSRRALVALLELELFARYCLETEPPDTPAQECAISIATAQLNYQWAQRYPVRQEVSPCALP